MKKCLLALCASLMLAFGAFVVQATASPSSAHAWSTSAMCTGWSRDGYWHWSPGYDWWYQYLGSPGPHAVTFQYYIHDWSHYGGQVTDWNCQY